MFRVLECTKVTNLPQYILNSFGVSDIIGKKILTK